MAQVEGMTPVNDPTDKSVSGAVDDESQAASDYHKLRRLLLGDDYSVALNHYISKEEDAERVADVLSAAVRLNTSENSTLGDALTPVVDKAIEKSIEENPTRITNAIYPIMGPAIRKAVASALAEMVQSLNTLLEQSLTLGSLNWRYRAWRAGIPYAQYVLLQTIKYRVEQVLLVHRETGLLLHSVTAPEVKTQDPELISSMLTAIGDFVSDSFCGGEETLERVRFGQLELQILVGPKAILAVAVRGSASDELALKASTTIETIHSRFNSQLAHFEGDRSDFDAAEPILSECLLSQKINENSKRKPWLAILLLLSGFTFLIHHQIEQYRYERLLDAFVEGLRQEPGYVVLSATPQEGGIEVALLRDLDSRPVDVTRRELLMDNAIRVTFRDTQVHFGPLPEPVVLTLPPAPEPLPPPVLESLPVELPPVPEPPPRPLINVESVLNGLLATNERVTIIAQGERLKLQGEISLVSLQRLQQSEVLAASYEVVDLSGITIAAPISVQGKLEELSRDIQQAVFYFEPKESELAESELAKVTAFIQRIKQLESAMAAAEISGLQLVVLGFADNTGTDFGNKKVSQQRADTIRTILVENGISSDVIVAWGAGNIDRPHVSDSSQRRVTVQVLYEASSLPSNTAAKADIGEN